MTRSAQDLLFTPEEVARQLGLHVKTVRRYIREGGLDAVRVGKRYRVTRQSLEAFAGISLDDAGEPDTPCTDVSTIVNVEAPTRDAADSMTTMLLASVNGRPDDRQPLRVETLFYPERSRLKIVIHGDLATTMAILALINTLIGRRS